MTAAKRTWPETVREFAVAAGTVVPTVQAVRGHAPDARQWFAALRPHLLASRPKRKGGTFGPPRFRNVIVPEVRA